MPQAGIVNFWKAFLMPGISSVKKLLLINNCTVFADGNTVQE
jgi:hypothetical protein